MLPCVCQDDGGYGEHGGPAHLVLTETKVDIGKREVVGFGGNGEVTCVNSAMAPFHPLGKLGLNMFFKLMSCCF